MTGPGESRKTATAINSATGTANGTSRTSATRSRARFTAGMCVYRLMTKMPKIRGCLTESQPATTRWRNRLDPARATTAGNTNGRVHIELAGSPVPPDIPRGGAGSSPRRLSIRLADDRPAGRAARRGLLRVHRRQSRGPGPVSYTHLRAHETVLD